MSPETCDFKHRPQRADMARTFLMIDGYNLMFAAGLGQPTYADGELQRCRQELLRLLAGTLSDDQRRDTIIVFDAANAPPDRSRTQKHAKMRVQFADEGLDADATLEQLIKNHSAPRQIVVVSSDHRLHKAARKRRAKAIDSQDFLRKLEATGERKTRVRQRTKSHGELNAVDWVQEFGDIPGARELQREHDRSRSRIRPEDFDVDNR